MQRKVRTQKKTRGEALGHNTQQPFLIDVTNRKYHVLKIDSLS